MGDIVSSLETSLCSFTSDDTYLQLSLQCRLQY